MKLLLRAALVTVLGVSLASCARKAKPDENWNDSPDNSSGSSKGGKEAVPPPTGSPSELGPGGEGGGTSGGSAPESQLDGGVKGPKPTARDVAHPTQ